MAKRATAHHSLLRLASVGALQQWNGSPTAPLKNARRLAPRGRAKGSAAGRDVSLSAWEVIGRKPSFCSFFFLKNPLARILGEVDNCACPSIAPCFFGGGRQQLSTEQLLPLI